MRKLFIEYFGDGNGPAPQIACVRDKREDLVEMFGNRVEELVCFTPAELEEEIRKAFEAGKGPCTHWVHEYDDADVYINTVMK